MQRSLLQEPCTNRDEKALCMGNTCTIKVKGIEQVNLVFTSSKTLTLNDVFYAPKVRKNLVSDFLLNRFGFKQVYEANNFILSKGSVLVGRDMLVVICSN